jgi:hypothetical protein
MTEFRFRLIVGGEFSQNLTDEELLDATDALGDAGCDDALISVHPAGLELEFDREQTSLQQALISAIQDVEKAGYQVQRIEMDRDALIAGS